MKIVRFADSYFQVVVCILLFGLLGAAGWYTYEAEHLAKKSYSTVVNAVSKSTTTSVKSFDDCVAGGNPVSQSFPETCTTKTGQLFTQGQ